MPDTGYAWVKTADGRERLMPVTEAAEREHYGSRFVSRAQRNAGYRLSKEAKAKLFAQTGVEFEDHGQYKAWCRLHGKRDIEKGEQADDSWRAFSEWTKGGQRGPCPTSPTFSGDRLRKPVSEDEIRGRAQERMKRMGLPPDMRLRLPAPDERMER